MTPAKKKEPPKVVASSVLRSRRDVNGQFPERPLTLRLPHELVRRIDDLLPHVGGDLSYAALGRVSRSQVLRIALLEGVKLLRKRYHLDVEGEAAELTGNRSS